MGDICYLGSTLDGWIIRQIPETAATHVLAVLISPEARNRKPYALPVQLIPYAGMNQAQIRDVINNVISEMSLLGMAVSGKHAIHCVGGVYTCIMCAYYRLC